MPPLLRRLMLFLAGSFLCRLLPIDGDLRVFSLKEGSCPLKEGSLLLLFSLPSRDLERDLDRDFERRFFRRLFDRDLDLAEEDLVLLDLVEVPDNIDTPPALVFPSEDEVPTSERMGCNLSTCCCLPCRGCCCGGAWGIWRFISRKVCGPPCN